MAELIQKQDTLNEGRVKLNAAITDAEQAKITADGADTKATQALANSENTQTQLDTIVINGDSSVEAAQARVDEKGVGHTTLKDRIDDGFTKVTSQLNDTNSQLAQTMQQIGTPPQGQPFQSIWEEFEQRGLNVKWFGAKGDGVTDDTAAIQNALDFASIHGGYVIFPIGTFITSSPLVVKWTATPDEGLPSFPKIAGIKGQGDNTVIRGTISEDGRAILELLGESNLYSVNIEISDFRLRMSGGSQRAYCLRVGDCKESFRAIRVKCQGANGMRLKVASSSSYAQMMTNFMQCSFRSNHGHEWFSDDNQADVYAVFPESSGARMDNIRFESCMFNGLVETRANIVEFDNCQFTTNPGRPTVSGRRFSDNVAVCIGTAKFSNCYFEDHHTAIFITPSLFNIDFVSINDCHFSGVSNYATKCQHAIRSENGTHILNVVDIKNCRFGSNEYQQSTIRNTASVNAYNVENIVNINAPSSSVTIENTQANFSIIETSVRQPRKSYTVKLQGMITQSDGILHIRVKDFANVQKIPITRRCWVSRVSVILDKKLNSGTITYRILRNGASVLNVTHDSLTKIVETNYETGYILNPSSSLTFSKDDFINMQVISSNLDVLEIPVEIELELAY